jgi:transcriptional regulator with XRE-family HTH domain
MPTKRFSQQHKAFCDVIRRAREKQGMTQATLARRLGVPQSYVSKYETGERRLDLLETLDICTTLGMSVQSIVRALGREIARQSSATWASRQNGE